MRIVGKNARVESDPPGPDTSDALRQPVWRALLALATSAASNDRCVAARCLALFAGIDEVDQRLVLLACDPEDSAVTEAAVDALARRADRVGWRLIVDAFATEPESYTRERMTDAVANALAWDWITPYDGLEELKSCVTDDRPAIASAAAEILREIHVPTADDRTP
jgi:hypothetical protein